MSLNGRNDLIKARMVGCFTRLWRQSPAVCGCLARRPSGGFVLSFFGAGQWGKRDKEQATKCCGPELGKHGLELVNGPIRPRLIVAASG
jgi:hypothetical protein